MTIALAGLDPEVRARAELAISWANYFKIPVTITSTMRTWAEQTKLRARYEACLLQGAAIGPQNPNPACHYPANRPGDSAHNYGLAWDSTVPEQFWADWTAIREWAGFHVPDNDRVHAEVHEWRNFATSIRRG